MKNCIYYLVLIVLGTGCKTIKPVGPSLPPSEISSTPLPETRINAPVTINLEQTFQDLDNSLQRSFGEERYVNGSLKYSWYINRNPINPTFNADGTLDMNDAGRWGVEVRGKNPFNGQWTHLAGCDADAAITLHAQFGLNNDYSLSGNVVKRNFTLATCNVTVINFPVAPIARGIAEPLIDRNLADFNSRISQYRFKDKFESIWNTLFRTIAIPGVGFLAINPEQMELGRLSGSGKTLHFEAGLMAKPVISLTDSPAPTIPALPELGAITGNGFRVYTDLLLQYPELSGLLRQNINGKKINYAKKGYILIKDIEVSGEGNEKLIVKLKFKAKYHWITYKGDLYLTCLPKYDPANQALYASEMNFDAGTEQRLRDRAAAWILNTALKAFLGNEVKIPIGQKLNDLKTKLSDALNRQLDPNILLSGQIADLTIEGILSAAQHMQIRSKAEGNVEVRIN